MEELGLKGLGNCFDSDDELLDGKDPSSPSNNLLLKSESSTCKLILKLKTTTEGYWKINESCSANDPNRELYHDPPLVKTGSYFKKLR